ncbi:MAG: tetratricopeptide repeat protein [Deltaproteobacteria bacterium]|nr:tetratricopeptide repeat protein [Deltaproteobacteria bacterium]
MPEKKDRKDLVEPDKLQLLLMKVREFADKNRTKLYTGAGILVLIFVLAGGYYFYQSNYEKKAGKFYSDIYDKTMKAAAATADAEAIKGYKELIAQYPRSYAALLAYYRLGNLYFRRQEMDSAITCYKEFIQKAPKDSDLNILAYSGLGACYEAKKDLKNALESFQKALNASAFPAFESFNYGNLARVYEAMNNPQKAVEFYQKALAKTTDPIMTLYLKRKIATLG